MGFGRAQGGSTGASSGVSLVGKWEVSGTQNISSTLASNTAVVFGSGSTTLDTDDMHDESTNNTKFFVPAATAGTKDYFLSCGLSLGAGPGTDKVLRITIRHYNSSDVAQGVAISNWLSGVGSNSFFITGSASFAAADISAGDYFQLEVAHNNGSALDISASHMSIWRS